MACSSHHWSSSEVYLEDVSGKTYRAIENMIKSTFDPCKVGQGRDARYLGHFGISVSNIRKVKNGKLRRKYRDFRDELREKNCDGHRVKKITNFPPKIWQFKKEKRHAELNEVYLFHGTSKGAARSIIQEGFDIDTTDPDGMFGRGIYFAEEITKADQYSDHKEDRKPDGTELTLLLCKVLMGNAHECSRDDAKKWKRSPCMLCDRRKCQHCWHHRYDSVLGSGEDMMFREFVVYDQKQCFPEFVITYERIGGWEPLETYE